jgi:PAS domain S-box-containing protein
MKSMSNRDADLADLRAAAVEQELRRSDAKIAAILEIAADAIIALDADMRITQFNDGAVAIFGYAKDELIGRSLDLLIPERFRSGHGAHVATFAASAVASRRMGDRREIFALRKDGTEFAAEASIAQLSQDNVRDLAGYILSLRKVP